MSKNNVTFDEHAAASALPSTHERAVPDGFAPGAPGYSEYCFGRRALLDAAALAQSHEGTVSATLLYRAAARLFGTAHERWQMRAPASAVIACTPWLELPATRAVLESLDAERRQRVRDILELAEGEATLATLDTQALEDLLAPLRRLALELAEPLERATAPMRQRQTARWLGRTLAWTALAVAITGALFGIFGRKNLARNAVVVTSSAEPQVRANPRALVDGDRKNLGFHTRKGRGESATIDLGESYPVQSIEVYNRFDCCQSRALPLRLEVSTDGITYAVAERRREPFTFWKVTLPSKSVRFLRLTDEGTNFFHLAEVEVY